MEIISKVTREKLYNRNYNRDGLELIKNTGLIGAKESPTSINPWHNLIKSSGISDKSDSSGESYGISKSAPFACSKIKTIFYTTYDFENTLATQGVSRLISFPVDEDKMTQGIGYYGETEKIVLFSENFTLTLILRDLEREEQICIL